ncbi:LPS-assembly protein LptD [Bartonella ancashensis]|nr:LPS-assembly protein LptD [Bartonella ancashensis]
MISLSHILFFVLSLSLLYPVQAQSSATFSGKLDSKDSFLLSADELIYNHSAYTVSAQGNVQIEYDGNKATAQKVTYNQKTGQVVAEGNVEITQKNGNKIYSSRIDMTKNFGDGFINALRIETINNTYFAAANARRQNDQIIIFNDAIYTACKPCHDTSSKEALWQIKAKKIIWNNENKTIRFEGGHFELFGKPIISFPIFELPDPTVKRASGFLIPHFSYNNNLGMGITNSYFWNLSPNYDFTLSSTIYMKQGLLTEGEWHQQFETGSYNVRFAHMYQINPHLFDDNTIDSKKVHRYMLATKGGFRINSHWTYGWDILAQSDQNFSRTYKLTDYNDPVQLSQIYLNGLAGKNYFDARFYHFQIQNSLSNDIINRRHFPQAWILPRVEYFWTADEPIYTGEISFHGHMRSIYRNHTYVTGDNWQNHSPNTTKTSEISGNNFLLTGELEWKKRFNTPNGLIIAPTLALRTNAITFNTHNNNTTYATDSSSIKLDTASSAIHSVATVGLELRYPLLITSKISSQILEPIVQIFVRNNEHYTEYLPNEDAQNFIFDATTLFQRNKFPGYDRIEGGTRTNIGLRYSGSFNNNWSFYSLIGQSLHLAGKNPFTGKDPISGLETANSDYVAMLNVNHNSGFSITSRGRFDQKTGKINHSGIEASQRWLNFKLAVQYAYLADKYVQNRQEISFQTSIKLSDNWSIGGRSGYDLAFKKFVKQGINLNYEDECFKIAFGYQQEISPHTSKHLKNFNLSLSLRTISDIGEKMQLN